MGDILHALPAVTALRATTAVSFLGWAVEPQWEQLLSASSAMLPARGPQMPVVDMLHRVPAKRWARHPASWTTIREIRDVRRSILAQRYDVCIDLQGALRSAWIGRMARAPRLVGEANPREPLAQWFFREHVETHGVHVIEQAREVITAALHQQILQQAAELPIDPVAERWCDEWIANHGIGRFVIMNPGAGWGAKRWPPERYAAVAAELAKMGYATVVNVGPGESQMADTICDAPETRAIRMAGNIGQLIACMRRASLFVGGDTGPLHLASALRIPVVGIYGPTDPARNGPFETNSRVLRHPASKRDHRRRSEPEAGLLTITVEDVLDAARELLNETWQPE